MAPPGEWRRRRPARRPRRSPQPPASGHRSRPVMLLATHGSASIFCGAALERRFSLRSPLSPRPSCEPAGRWPLRPWARASRAAEKRVFVRNGASEVVLSQGQANLNVLLVRSWHILPPDRFLQSKYCGAKRGAPRPPSRVWEFTGHGVLKGTAGFSP